MDFNPDAYIAANSAAGGSKTVQFDPDAYIQANTEKPGMLESAGRGFLRNLPLGQQAAAAIAPINPLSDRADYSGELAHLTDAAEASKKANPISYYTGATAGALAPLAIPGVGEALGAESLGTAVASNAALGAAGSISDTNVVKDPEKAGKEALLGGAVGGGTAGLLNKILPGNKFLEETANEKAVQAMNLNPRTLGVPTEELHDLGSFMRDADLVQGDTASRVAKADDLLKQVGAQIGELGGDATAFEPGADRIAQFTDPLMNKLEESAKFFGTEGNQDVSMYRQALANIQNNGQSFEGLQALKSAYGRKAFNDSGEIVNNAASDVYGTIKDMMKDIVQSGPEEYQQHMGAYSKLLDIKDGLTHMLQTEQAKGMKVPGIGMMGRLTGILGGSNPAVNIGLGAAMAPFHPLWALGAMTPIAMNPQAMEKGLTMIGGSALPKATSAVSQTGTDFIMSALTKNPKVFGQFSKPLLQAAQSGGKQGVAATHFILSNQYPKYNEMAHHLATEGVRETLTDDSQK